MNKFINGIISFLGTLVAWCIIVFTSLSIVLVPPTVVVGCFWLLTKMFGG